MDRLARFIANLIVAGHILGGVFFVAGTWFSFNPPTCIPSRANDYCCPEAFQRYPQNKK